MAAVEPTFVHPAPLHFGGYRRPSSFVHRLPSLLLFLLGLTLFTSALAPGIVFGDPTEYTLIPHLGAILHPPGYALMTLLVKAWQTLIPLGSLAYRTNLLAATVGALGGIMVYGMVKRLKGAGGETPARTRAASIFQTGSESPALLAALSLYTASNYWQHSIHTNAHILTAMLASISLFVLLHWRATQNDRWLWVFGLVAGLSVTHHPLLVLGFPAYALFILLNRPRFKSLLLCAGGGLLGLTPWLYFPIRSAIQPPPAFGPHDMNTLDGFLNLALARGLTNVNLFHFGWAEQWQRAIVFWSLIQLQYAWPLLVLAAVGLIWLARRDKAAALLLSLHALFNLIFTLNSVQDVMAYLLPPLVSLAALIGAGALALKDFLQFPQFPRFPPFPKFPHFPFLTRFWDLGFWDLGFFLSILLLFLFPLTNLFWLYPRVSLHNWREADRFVESVFEHFGGKGTRAVLLSDWEHVTPLWYWQYAEGKQLDPNDVTVVYVNKPFVDAVWENIDRGPIYLIEYNPAIVNTGFRLRAEGPLYRLEPPPAITRPEIPHPVEVNYGPIQLLGYDLPARTRTAQAGEIIPISLYMRANEATDRIIHPYARLGPWEFRFTTDSHLLTPDWQAGEIIVERWEVIAPLTAAPGDYPLQIGFSDLTTGEEFAEVLSLGEVKIIKRETMSEAGNPAWAANFGQRVGVDWAQGWVGISPTRTAPWATPLAAKPGDSIELRIQWRALTSPENSYTVFVHLLSADNALIVSEDYTPLGGAWPTMLWFPKWLPGQTAVDPYSLAIPVDAAPGDYYLEIGLYGLRSVARVPAFDLGGNLAGDRFVLGGVRVE